MPSAISAITIGGVAKRASFAQLRDLGIFVDGHSPNYAFCIRTKSTYALGMTAPGAPVAASSSAGLVAGTVRYRIRWHDSNNGTMSLPSADLTVTANNQIITVTHPGSAPARATHWILERTAENGKSFYVVNIDTVTGATEFGTVKATLTFDDNIPDALLVFRRSLHSRNAPLTRPYLVVRANEGRAFYLGRAIYQVTATVTNGSTAVTLGAGFITAHVGLDMTASGDTDAKSYRITAQSGTGLTLADNYIGGTGSKTITITGPGDFVAWSEPDSPEHCGTAAAGGGGVSNELRVGDDGERLTSGVGLGPLGFLYAKAHRLYFHKYRRDPSVSNGDGEIVPLASGRGVLAPDALRYYDGMVYGIDHQGVYRMSPGGFPEDIGWPIQHEFQRNALNWNTSGNWHLGRDPYKRMLYVFLTEGTDTYPKKAWLYNMQKEQWENCKVYPWGVTCTTELPDQSGAFRMAFYSEAVNAVAGALYIPSYCWIDGMGTSFGAPSATTPLNGQVTGGVAGTLISVGATWPTTNGGLRAVTATKVAKLNGSRETRLIVTNTADTLTLNRDWTATPVAGDWYQIGEIPCRYFSPRFAPGGPDRKTRFYSVTLWVKFKSVCGPLCVTALYNGSSESAIDHTDQTADGITQVAANGAVMIDPTYVNASGEQVHRFEIKLNRKLATDVRLVIYSDQAGAPWEIYGPIRMKYKVDDCETPRKV